MTELPCKDCGSQPELMWWPNAEIDAGSRGIKCPTCGYEITGYFGSLILQFEVWNERNKKTLEGE